MDFNQTLVSAVETAYNWASGLGIAFVASCLAITLVSWLLNRS